VQIAAVVNCEVKNTVTSGKLIIAVCAAYVSKSLVLNARSLQVFQSHKNTTFHTILTIQPSTKRAHSNKHDCRNETHGSFAVLFESAYTKSLRAGIVQSV